MTGFAIICDPHTPGLPNHCTVVAMVDRAKDRALWWTATAMHKIMRFRNRGAAVARAEALKHNPRVVPYDVALKAVASQAALDAEVRDSDLAK